MTETEETGGGTSYRVEETVTTSILDAKLVDIRSAQTRFSFLVGKSRGEFVTTPVVEYEIKEADDRVGLSFKLVLDDVLTLSTVLFSYAAEVPQFYSSGIVGHINAPGARAATIRRFASAMTEQLQTLVSFAEELEGSVPTSTTPE